MHYYYVVDLGPPPDGLGRAPILPEGVGFLELACPQREYTFALYLLGPNAAGSVDPAVAQPVPPDLAILLDAAQEYPPALALMRDEVAGYPTDFRPAFLALVTERLQAHLHRRETAPYFPAQARESELGYKYDGEWYWIVAYHPATARRPARVGWVSDDFFVYTDPVTHFHVDEADLAQRFRAFPGR